MGYTHYAHIPASRIEDEQWSYLQNQIMALTITDDWEEKEVILTTDLIQVKGNHEWFVIPRKPHSEMTNNTFFTFTKTARKPYDYIIVACYMALYRAVKGVKLLSDGNYRELAEGRQHYADTFGLDNAQIQEVFDDTIHDRRPEWYIGDPCYAIADHQWDEFTNNIPTDDTLEGNGIEFEWKYGFKAYVYNSGLGGDGSVNVHGHKLSVDTGMLSVLPIAICNNDMNGGAVVRSLMRPVFDIDTDNFPHVTLTFNGNTAHDNLDKVECDDCDEWWDDNDMQTDAKGNTLCYQCYEEVDEGEDA
tara:strand:- start:1158 stop:2066 length:909 start_codon:yes stop_codon:yes gene_type:complete